MIKKIVVYPTPPSVEYATDVRIFDNKLYSIIDDLKDTIQENNCDGLSAYQIGNFYNVIVVKKDNNFIELINPRLISTNGKITTKEKTAYFPNLSAKVERFKDISVVYQDRDGINKVIKASDEFAILLQRKIDYTFGSTFLNKLSKDEKYKFEQKLEFGSDITIPESCPMVSYKDYILKFGNILTILIGLLLIYSFFITDKNILTNIWQYQLNISYVTLFVGIIYVVYGQYEGKYYSSCTSCQIGNIFGSTFLLYARLSFLMLGSYLIV
jgi:peptide deformylase